MLSKLSLAINASLDAGKAILEVYDRFEITEVQHKKDNSPLTQADLASNDIINSYLTQDENPIISEENKLLSYQERKNWEYFWMVDPLDGTKEFIKKNGEFTVNIAFCHLGKPIFGVIYVPVSRELYYANISDNEAFKTVVSEEHELINALFDQKDRIMPGKQQDSGPRRVVGSRSHMNPETQAYIKAIEQNNQKAEIVSKGSSLKFCLVAEGKADVYPRFAPTMEWDTAAGHAICNAVGLKVTDRMTNKELRYNKENLLNPHFIVSP